MVGRLVMPVCGQYLSFGWEVPDFALFSGPSGESLMSPGFTPPGLDMTWSLQLYPHEESSSRDPTDDEYTSLYLHYKGGSKVKARVQLAFRPDGKEALCRRTAEYLFAPSSSDVVGNTFWGLSKFVRRQQLLDSLPDNASPLLVVCEVHVVSDASAALTCRPPTRDAESVVRLGHAMYEDCSAADVVLVVKGCEVPAHRIVLMAQSPVFRAMFGHELTEKITGRIEMQDHSVAAVREMKRFMYTGEVEGLGDVGAELLDLAAAYDLPKLRKLCATALPWCLSQDNACRIFAAAHVHSLQELKDSVVRFISHRCDVMATSEWQQYIAADAELVTAFCMAQADVIQGS